ncbi:MAG: hypothetical protein ACJ790_10405 [Myxococcaceae bacterium]
MTDDFVTETDKAVGRLHKKRRMRQIMFGGGLSLFSLLVLLWLGAGGIGAGAFGLLVVALAIVLYLEWDGMRLERQLEAVPMTGKRVHFLSGRDGLVFATEEQLFVEGRGRFYELRSKGYTISEIGYLGETHELNFAFQAAEGTDPARYPAFAVQLPRDMTPQNGTKLAKQLDGWAKKVPAPAAPAAKELATTKMEAKPRAKTARK